MGKSFQRIGAVAVGLALIWWTWDIVTFGPQRRASEKEVKVKASEEKDADDDLKPEEDE